MSVFFKFRSCKEFTSIPIDERYISIRALKERIFDLKHLGGGTDFDLVVSNAQTNQEYTDEADLVPRNTSVLIRRVPGHARIPIVAEQDRAKTVEDNVQNITPSTSSVAPPPSTMKPEESEWDDFGDDPYTIIPERQQALSFNPASVPSSKKLDEDNMQNITPAASSVAPPPSTMKLEEPEWDDFGDDPYTIMPERQHALSFNPATVSSSKKLDEDRKFRAVVETSCLDWSSHNDGYKGGRGNGRGMGRRMTSGRGFGRRFLEQRNPPPGYVCRRCKVPGHFIQHCPTNGDPAYDVKRIKFPTGIPKSMLIATPDGSYALPNGTRAVLQPDEAAFEKEMERIPTVNARKSTELVPENHFLRCPVCKEVMKDAVLTSKCCFKSFCDNCIRDHIINKSKCVCGAAHVLADDLLPNLTLRETISQILESAAASSQEKVGSFVQIEGMQSAMPEREKVPSLAVSGLTEEPKGPAFVECSPEAAANTSEVKTVKALVASDATPDSLNYEDPKSAIKSSLIKDNVGNSPTGDQEMRGVDGFGGMQMAGPPSNPFFGSTMPPTAMDPFMWSHPHGSFGGVFPRVPDPFMAHPYLNVKPLAPRRDLAELALGNIRLNMGPPQKEDFKGRRVGFCRRRDMQNHRRDVDGPFQRLGREGRDCSTDWYARRDVPSARDGSLINKHTDSRAYRTCSFLQILIQEEVLRIYITRVMLCKCLVAITYHLLDYILYLNSLYTLHLLAYCFTYCKLICIFLKFICLLFDILKLESVEPSVCGIWRLKEATLPYLLALN